MLGFAIHQSYSVYIRLCIAILTIYNVPRLMAQPKTSQINVRLSPEMLDEIAKLVDSGEFDNSSSFIRYAIKYTLGKYQGRIPSE